MFDPEVTSHEKLRARALLDHALLAAWLAQVGKDTGLSFYPNSTVSPLQYDDCQRQLCTEIRQWLRTDREKMRRILYTVDVPENKLAALLSQTPDADEAQLLANSIMERCLQKVWLRRLFSQS
jgi:hypothetical protein